LATLLLKSITKNFGTTTVCDNLTLEVNDKELLVILGPSGCGKTTTLRCIAGFETPESGEILIDGKMVNEVPPRDRDIAMVFQNYAIYPHMRVRDNIGFPLKVRHLPKTERNERVHKVAKLLKIEPLLDRKPAQLSGGEQQRVALGRALIREPKLFLMDEPLSNLDAKLRVEMRSEIKRIQHELGITTIFVTHDQAEAMAIADKIAIMHKGILQQVGSPMEVYNRPSNVMVAGFIGSPAMNFIDGQVEGERNSRSIRVGDTQITIPEESAAKLESVTAVSVGFRPEDAFFEVGPPLIQDALPAEVYTVEPMGTNTILTLKGAAMFRILASPDLDLKSGDKGNIRLKKNRLHVFDKNSGKRVF
jgi:multiple sugar transport system ATP-binding protein